MIDPRWHELESELDGLDIPALSLDILVDSVCDSLEMDPVETMRKLEINPDDPEVPHLLRALIYEGIESGTQIPHIRRALEIGAEMLEMEE